MPDGMDDEISGEGYGEASDRADENAQAMREDALPHIEVEISRPKTAKEREEEKLRRKAELEEELRHQKEEEQRQKELELRRRKRKLITPGVVLIAGAIASITMFFMGFDNRRMLILLLVVLLVAWFAGSLIQYMFERFAAENEVVPDEGEVINKGLAPSEEVRTDEDG